MFEELKTFIAVVDFKNFTKAGNHLNLSQPTVSTHIKNLETFFGTTLINRSVKQKNIFITEKGYILYKRAKEVLNLMDVTYKEISNSSTTITGTLKIGASSTIGDYILPKFLSIFSEKYPDINVEIFTENTSAVCSDIRNFILDIGLIEGNLNDSNFNKGYFLKDKLTLALPFESDLTEDNFLFSSLQNKKWIVRENGSGTRDYLDLFLSKYKILPKSIMVVGSNYAVKESIKNKLGISIISKFIANPAVENSEISTITLDNTFTRNFSYILPKDVNVSEAAHIFLRELKLYSTTLE
ncbi:LysR substrate-binding domain-containing protein [Romboutsia sp. 1001713B170207_170306_H8]|uniref:LysR substrate-binding domain-containing protein n=1 Tax=Romboutsia sp. 1001713B170207_170306_H8 TaxID=2787112 RepID=UPI00082081C6|nr:LysR substrate-binding domain-containing protein [Romboutsia sp. 1001713B170207_170306_H8]SCI33891.1 CysJI operon transcriptional activator [uncultured Clostridium sp.]